MASNHTEHYGLSQWAAGDSFLREEFNEDFRRIDQGLKGLEWVMGSYIGLRADSNMVSDSVELGFRARIVVITHNNMRMALTGFRYGGLMSPELPLCVGGDPETWSARITDTGFQVRNHQNTLMNSYNMHYHYIALR